MVASFLGGLQFRAHGCSPWQYSPEHSPFSCTSTFILGCPAWVLTRQSLKSCARRAIQQLAGTPLLCQQDGEVLSCVHWLSLVPCALCHSPLPTHACSERIFWWVHEEKFYNKTFPWHFPEIFLPTVSADVSSLLSKKATQKDTGHARRKALILSPVPSPLFPMAGGQRAVGACSRAGVWEQPPGVGNTPDPRWLSAAHPAMAYSRASDPQTLPPLALGPH